MEENNDFLKVDDNKPKKGKQTLVVALGIAIVVFAVILTVVIVGAIVNMRNVEDTTRYETTSNNIAEITTDEQYLKDILNVDETVAQSEESDKAESSTSGSAAGDTTKNQLVESYENLSVNGENMLSDHYDNEFIQLVSNKYGVDSDLLVAIYSVPDSGTNFVLQFSGKKKGEEYVKSPDTLEKVYQIDKDRNIKVATGTSSGNEGVSYAESVMCMAMVKKLVMTQYPNYFTGLE